MVSAKRGVSGKKVITKQYAPFDTWDNLTGRHNPSIALAASISVILLLIASIALPAQPAQHMRTASKDPFNNLVATFKTPKDVEAYVFSNFRYQEDKQDRLKSVRRFMYDRSGDCEDYSLFIGSALEKMGYTVDVLEMHFRRGGEIFDHRIVLFHDEATRKEYYLQGYPDGFTDGRISRPYDSTADLIRALETMWRADPGPFPTASTRRSS